MSGAVRTSASTPLWFIENLAYIHVDGDQTDNAFSLVEVQGRHGDMPPLHVHNRDDESFFVLDGELTLFVGHEEMKLSKGSAAVAPRQVPHCYRVESEMATFLVINSPAGFERFVAAAGEQAPSANCHRPAGTWIPPHSQNLRASKGSRSSDLPARCRLDAARGGRRPPAGRLMAAVLPPRNDGPLVRAFNIRLQRQRGSPTAVGLFDSFDKQPSDSPPGSTMPRRASVSALSLVDVALAG